LNLGHVVGVVARRSRGDGDGGKQGGGESATTLVADGEGDEQAQAEEDAMRQMRGGGWINRGREEDGGTTSGGVLEWRCGAARG
jgi:hypothetical protein